MANLNSNDYKILESIIDREKNRGLSTGRGSTKKQIMEKAKLSNVKVGNTLKALLEEELIAFAVKHAQANTYCITEKGIAKLKELKTNII